MSQFHQPYIVCAAFMLVYPKRAEKAVKSSAILRFLDLRV